MTEDNGKCLAVKAAAAAQTKQAQDVTVLDLRELTSETDFFVILSSETHVQLRAVRDAVTEQLKVAGAELRRVEGRDDNNWILLDYGSFIVHLFLAESRSYYDLERLWADAVELEVAHEQ